jgi:hypothetical protein
MSASKSVCPQCGKELCNVYSQRRHTEKCAARREAKAEKKAAKACKQTEKKSEQTEESAHQDEKDAEKVAHETPPQSSESVAKAVRKTKPLTILQNGELLRFLILRLFRDGDGSPLYKV